MVLTGLLFAVASPALADVPSVMLGTMPSLSQGRPSGARTGFVPAPLPDPDRFAPDRREADGIRVTPRLTRPDASPGAGGDGFAPGSAFSGSLERRNRNGQSLASPVAPSLNLRLPLR